MAVRMNMDVLRRDAFEMRVDGEAVEAHPGESVAAAMLAAGRRGARRSVKRGEERGYFCGMGVCWECAVQVEGVGIRRACMEPARPGLVLRTGVDGLS